MSFLDIFTRIITIKPYVYILEADIFMHHYMQFRREKDAMYLVPQYLLSR